MRLRSLSPQIHISSRAWTFALIGLLLFLGFLILRLPFRAQFLINWDAVNFALGIELFDLRHHQPHPPGYIGYIAIGRLLNQLTGDANTSLTILSVVSGAAAPVILFALARRFMRRRYAIATAVFFGLSPVVWYYSEVALTYAVEMLVALIFVWQGYEARLWRSRKALLIATLFLSFLGAIRQSGLVLLLPLWLYFLWPFSRSTQIRVVAAFAAANLAWFVPLIHYSGGLQIYLAEMADLAGFMVVPTSVATFSLWAPLQNAAFTALAFLLAINFGVIVLLIARRHDVHPLRRLDPSKRRFFYVWVIPAIVTFILVHTGQLGYILLVLPALFLLIGMTLSDVIGKLSQRAVRAHHSPIPRPVLFVVLTAFLALSSAATFFGLQRVVTGFSPGEAENVRESIDDMQGTLPVLEETGLEEDNDALLAATRQFSLKRNDARWAEMISLVEKYDSETTVLLASADGSLGSFRHLAYYLPQYRVYAIGEDRRGTYGYLYMSYRRNSNFTVDELEFARTSLPLPGGVQRLIIPDAMVFERLAADIPAQSLREEDGEVVVATVEQNSTLTFIDPPNRRQAGACAPMEMGDSVSYRSPEAEPVILALSGELARYRRILCRAGS